MILKSVVYLAETSDRRYLKIGVTVEPHKRIRQLSEMAGPMRFIGFQEGDEFEEREMLNYARSFAASATASGKEWFLWERRWINRLLPHFPLRKKDLVTSKLVPRRSTLHQFKRRRYYWAS